MPRTGSSIQVGSARRAKSKAPDFARGAEWDLEQQGIAQHRFEVRCIPIEAISVVVVLESESSCYLDLKVLPPLFETAMTGEPKLCVGRTARDEHTTGVLQHQIGVQLRPDRGQFETPVDGRVQDNRTA